MNIVADNPPVNHLEKSFLSSSIAAGVSSISLKNADRFSAEAIIMIGAPGRERTEIISIDDNDPTPAVVGTTVRLAGTTEFPHDADDPVYVLEYDKVRVYRSTTGEAGAYNLLATVDVDADNQDNRTYYIDTTGMTTYFYKLAYYHSGDDEESERTSPIPATGYDKKMVGTIIAEVANEVKDPDFMYMDINAYISHMNDINDDLITQAKRPYRFLKTKQSINIEEDDSTFDFPETLWKIDYTAGGIQANDVVGGGSTHTHQPKVVSPAEIRYDLSLQGLGGDWVDQVAIDQEADQVIFSPKARADRVGAFTIYFYKFFDQLTSLSDRVETPNKLVYKLGLKREYYMIRSDDDDKYLKKALQYDQRYNAEVMKLQREKNVMADGPTGLGPDRKRYPQFGGRRYRQ